MSSTVKVIRRLSRLLTLLDGSGEGGLEITKAIQIKKNDDFKLVIVFRIECQNSGAINQQSICDSLELRPYLLQSVLKLP